MWLVVKPPLPPDLQLSWSVPHKEAVIGTQTINFYNEEGSAGIRKVMTEAY